MRISDIFDHNRRLRGYLDDQPATAAALEGGWLHCGDLAWMDSEGFVFVVDRKSDMLVTGGQNVYPREIEQVIAGPPEVANVAVFGGRDRIWGENDSLPMTATGKVRKAELRDRWDDVASASQVSP